jgi:hypothetical protein
MGAAACSCAKRLPTRSGWPGAKLAICRAAEKGGITAAIPDWGTRPTSPPRHRRSWRSPRGSARTFHAAPPAARAPRRSARARSRLARTRRPRRRERSGRCSCDTRLRLACRSRRSGRTPRRYPRAGPAKRSPRGRPAGWVLPPSLPGRQSTGLVLTHLLYAPAPRAQNWKFWHDLQSVSPGPPLANIRSARLNAWALATGLTGASQPTGWC